MKGKKNVMTKALFEQEDCFMWVIVDKHCYPTGDTKNNFNETIDQLVEEGEPLRQILWKIWQYRLAWILQIW